MVQSYLTRKKKKDVTASVKQSVSIPVIGNGDIKSAKEATFSGSGARGAGPPILEMMKFRLFRIDTILLFIQI